MTQRGLLWLDGATRTVKKTFAGLFTKAGQRRRHDEQAYRRDEDSEDAVPTSDPPAWTSGVNRG
jgi:hypothetical protein